MAKAKLQIEEPPDIIREICAARRELWKADGTYCRRALTELGEAMQLLETAQSKISGAGSAIGIGDLYKLPEWEEPRDLLHMAGSDTQNARNYLATALRMIVASGMVDRELSPQSPPVRTKALVIGGNGR